MTSPIPENYPRISTYLCVNNASDAIAFYCEVFGATERMRMEMMGSIGHAEIEIGDSLIMLSDPFPDMGAQPPESYGGTPVHMSMYVDDVDATFAKAIEHGAESISEPENQFWGDRSGKVKDPWGHVWGIATHVEDVSPEEMDQRAKAAFG